jgi:hypothetical protein
VVDLETLNGSLNGEPAGTAAHALELAAISELLELCERVGYGRVARLACGMREIWLCPGRARQFAARRRQAMLAEAESR